MMNIYAMLASDSCPYRNSAEINFDFQYFRINVEIIAEG